MAGVRTSDTKQETYRYQTRNNHEPDHSFCVLINISDEENREDLQEAPILAKDRRAFRIWLMQPDASKEK
jgi:hypothetical protein